MEKMSKDMKGIGYNSESSNSKIMFVVHVKKIEFIMSGYKSQHPNQCPKVHAIISWVCHCFTPRGHIRHYCFQIYGRSSHHNQPHTQRKVRDDARLQKFGEARKRL